MRFCDSPVHWFVVYGPRILGRGWRYLTAGWTHYAKSINSASGVRCVALMLLAAGLAATGLLSRAQTCTTAITGTVYSPLGPTLGDPLPNILVYVPTTPVLPLPSGLGNSCTATSQLVSGTPLVSATTGFDGTFTLADPKLAGSNVTLVVQAGKWRRQYTGLNVPACQTTKVTASMPQNQSQGDLPQIAISTGAADALECVFRKIGISDSEFTAAGGPGRISLYAGSQVPGITADAQGKALPSETALVSNPDTLKSYDLSLFACQGTPTNPAAGTAANPTPGQQNLVDYANIGGRIFATHFSYVWLNNSTVFKGTANWVPDQGISPGQIDATIDQTYPEGLILAKWLQTIGATPTLGQLPLFSTKKDQTGVNPPSQSWATLNDPAFGNPVMQFTFDTPINATTTPSIALSFTNNPAIFSPGDAADTVTINVTDTSAAAAIDATLNMSITLPPGLTAQSLVGVGANTGWVCAASALLCNRVTPLAAGATDPVSLVVGVSPTAPLGAATISAAIAGGGLSGTNQCGRVLYNEYHVETVSTGQRAFPRECVAGAVMTPQEKFLEFSLYNLSNFVAPVTTDTVKIQALSVLTWATPAPITYGTALSATQLNATASVPGTFVYTPPAGTIPPVGIDTLSVLFTPTDNVAYSTATASVKLQVSLIPTTSRLVLCVDGTGAPYPCGTPITSTPLSPNISMFFGQVVDGYGQVDAADHSALTGTITFFDGTRNICVLPVSTGGQCPASAGMNFAPGVHAVTAVYSGDTTHAASTSNVVTVTVAQGATKATVVSSLNPASFGAPVTFTATVSSTFAVPVGAVVFLDNGTPIGTVALDASGKATLTPSTLSVGLHPITVVYAATANFQGATSPVLQQVIKRSPVVIGTAVLLASGTNPSVVGESVTFTASVNTPGPFIKIATGSVTFLEGKSVLGTGKLDKLGMAQFSTSSLGFGNHNITASYSGDATTTGNVSAVLVQVVNAELRSLPVGFTLTVTPVPVTVATGSMASMLVTVSPISGFSMPVALGCSGLPGESACTFGLESVPVGGGTTTMQLSTMAPHDCGDPGKSYASSQPGKVGWGMTGPALAGLVLLCVPGRRRWTRGLLAVVAVAWLAVLSGCGHCTDLGTRPGIYTFAVTGTAAASGPGVLPVSQPAVVTQQVKVTVVVP